MEYTSKLTAEVVEHMGSDQTVAMAARVSTGKEDDAGRLEGLINYLVREKHCYDDQTEILTRRDGWKFFKDVSFEDEVLTRDLKGEMTWDFPTDIIKEPYVGDMIHLSGRNLDLVVTPNHRMLASHRTKQGFQPLAIHGAAEFENRTYKVPRGGGVLKQGISVPLERARLLGFVVADAHVGKTAISFHLRKERKISWLKEQTAGEIQSQANDTYGIPLGWDEELTRLARLTYDSAKDRVIPDEVLETWDGESVQAFLEGFLEGDGHQAEGRTTARTSSAKLAQQLQVAAILAGGAATVHGPFDYGARSIASGFAKTVKPSYSVVFAADRHLEVRVGWTHEERERQVQRKQYAGTVYCVTVPSGIVMVRRNGETAWSGNSSTLEHCVVTFKIEAPIFVAREAMRHRTFCLAGDSTISFSRPDNGLHYPYQLDRLHKNWNDPAQRGRLEAMKIRVVDEETREVTHSKIVDVIYSGRKKVYTLTLENGSEVTGSEDHKIFTVNGWSTIGNLMEAPAPVAIMDSHKVPTSVPQFIPDHEDSEWRAIPGWEGKYEVSDAGNVRGLLGTRGGVLETPALKKRTVGNNGYLVVSLSKGGKSRAVTVHKLVTLAFIGERPEGMEVLHKDGNRLNVSIENLVYGSSGQNSADMVGHGTRKKLGIGYSSVKSIELRGEEDTYDISVEGPNHNFFANGVVVHNSYNEISGRYAKLEPKFYIPDTTRPLVNKGTGAHPDLVHGDESNRLLKEVYYKSHEVTELAYEVYESLIEQGVATEVARNVLPVSIYTRWYQTANLNNWFKFLELRQAENAQWEIRQIANQVADALETLYPVTVATWRRHRA